MSTLLERMIQRTRAPLSSLEPLSSPQFSGRPAQRQGADSASESTSTAPAESGLAGATNAFPPLLPRPELPREGLARGPRADGPTSLAAGPRPTEADPPTMLHQPGLKPEVHAASAGHDSPAPAHTWPEPAASGHRRPDVGQTSSEPAASGRPKPDAEQTPPEPAAATPARQVSSGVSVDSLLPEVEKRAEPASEEPGAVPAIAPLPVPARLVPERRMRAFEGSGESPAPRRSTADADVSPDVTISISHIEVRAAPSIESPRHRPPFRPRVSLDDFLTQRQDRRR